MYKKLINFRTNMDANMILRVADNAFIPLDPANTDYQQFKSDLANGAQLQAADGTEMTADQIKTFLEGLK